MTICVRDRFSTTRSACVSPTFSWLALSAMRSTPFDRSLGGHADAARGDHQFALLVAILGDAFAEGQLAGALALAFPGFAGLLFHGQHVAGTQRAVILEVLFGVQSAAAAGPILHAAGRLAGAEPRLSLTHTQRIVWIELRHRLRKGRWRDDAAHLRLLR